MATEIEHKFLVDTALWHPKDAGLPYRQGYLSSKDERVVRVRIAGEDAYLTVKGVTKGMSRLEFEYPIPVADAVVMLDRLCERPLIEKTRHREMFDGHIWEIDVFHGENEGLVIAEVEVSSAADKIARPSWVTDEVSEDPRYFNTNLVSNPYKNWN